MKGWNPFGKVDMEVGSFLKASAFNKEYTSDDIVNKEHNHDDNVNKEKISDNKKNYDK